MKSNINLTLSISILTLFTLLGLTINQFDSYQDKYKESEIYYKKDIQKNPMDSNAYTNLGYSLFKQGHYKQAEINYKRAIEINDGHSMAHNYLGLLYDNKHGKEVQA